MISYVHSQGSLALTQDEEGGVRMTRSAAVPSAPDST